MEQTKQNKSTVKKIKKNYYSQIHPTKNYGITHFFGMIFTFFKIVGSITKYYTDITNCKGKT